MARWTDESECLYDSISPIEVVRQINFSCRSHDHCQASYSKGLRDFCLCRIPLPERLIANDVIIIRPDDWPIVRDVTFTGSSRMNKIAVMNAPTEVTGTLDSKLTLHSWSFFGLRQPEYDNQLSSFFCWQKLRLLTNQGKFDLVYRQLFAWTGALKITLSFYSVRMESRPNRSAAIRLSPNPSMTIGWFFNFTVQVTRTHWTHVDKPDHKIIDRDRQLTK